MLAGLRSAEPYTSVNRSERPFLSKVALERGMTPRARGLVSVAFGSTAVDFTVECEWLGWVEERTRSRGREKLCGPFLQLLLPLLGGLGYVPAAAIQIGKLTHCLSSLVRTVEHP